ncbi:unnamed protein product [Diamesa serratosioi]
MCALVNRNKNHEIIAQQKDIDKVLKSLNPEAFRKTKTKAIINFILKSFVIHFIGIGFETFMMISLTPGNLDWRNSWAARLFSNNALRMADTLYLYYCDYLSSRLSLFNQELGRMSSEKQNLKQLEWPFMNKLKVLKAIDLKIYKLSNDIRAYFKHFLLANISSYIMIIVIDVYWIYASLLFRSNPYSLQSYFCPWQKVASICLLFLSAQNIQNEVDQISGGLHAIKTDNLKIYKSIRNFSLQKLHTQIMMDAFGFFYLNFSALVGIADTISTYMIYFCQFMSDVDVFSPSNITAANTTAE